MLKDKNKSYSEIIEVAQRQLTPIRIEIKENNLYCGKLYVNLQDVDQAFYFWLLKRHQKEEQALSFIDKTVQNQLTTDFIKFYGEFTNYSGHWEKLREETFKELNENTYQFPIEAKYVQEHRSKINKSLEQALGKPAATPYLINSWGKRGKMKYGLSEELKPEHIHIKFNN